MAHLNFPHFPHFHFSRKVGFYLLALIPAALIIFTLVKIIEGIISGRMSF